MIKLATRGMCISMKRSAENTVSETIARITRKAVVPPITSGADCGMKFLCPVFATRDFTSTGERLMIKGVKVIVICARDPAIFF